MRRRTLWVTAFCLVLWVALGARLWQVQVSEGALLAREAHAQRVLALPVAGGRGVIRDRNGVPLTDSRPAWGVAVFPPLVSDRQGVARALSRTLAVSEEELLWRIAGRRPVWLALPVTAEAAAAVEQMRLPGIVAAPTVQRYGPLSLARHLVGYINQEGGMLGLEAELDADLGGEATPNLVAYMDGKGRPLRGIGIKTIVGTGKSPYDVLTTIDSRLQRAVELALDANGAARVGVVVVDVRTGDVLAMASRPNFDQARDPGRRIDLGEAFLLNRSLMALEPGSVMKPMVVGAALEAAAVRPDERFLCTGHYDLGGGYRPQCALYPGGHGWVSLLEALERSCNVALIQVGYERLGAEGLRQMARTYGFGNLTPLGLRGEQAGALSDLLQPYQAVQMSFGQGMTATPLQVARAFAAIANGGMMPPLRLLREVRATDGTVVRRPAEQRSVRVMSTETAKFLGAALAAVTAPDGQGTGRRAWVPGYGSAGKTGSAEGSDDGMPALHAWFAGYTPLEAPRYAIAVMVQGGGAGGEVAAPLFREVARALFAAAP